MKRVLIFVVAYNAERTLSDVVRRIRVDDDYDAEVLVIDDASTDRTFSVGLGAEIETPLKTTVLTTPVNQGYGGNQKLGYRWAIDKGFDVVGLLHGDGQYAPEYLADLVRPVVDGEADACFGSRMLLPGAARKGGMPLYKRIGNRILSGFQNWALGQRLSEYHSGYRVYSTAALERVSFELNDNGFVFDNEIIVQLIGAGMRIVERPIPTYYGDEICYVNGLGYAWGVVKTTVAFRLHQFGLFYRLGFDAGPAGYSGKLTFDSSHLRAISGVAARSTVVDIGCGNGRVGRALIEQKDCLVYGVDNLETSPTGLARYVRLDLARDALPDWIGEADWVLLLDVLEHVHDVEGFLLRLRERVRPLDTRIIITTPNIAFLSQRTMLLLGQFNYGSRGILDKTHVRLFTFGSLKRTLRSTGYIVERVEGIPAPFPLAVGEGWLGRGLLALNRALIALWRRGFAYQIYMELQARPTTSSLMERTLSHSQSRRRRLNRDAHANSRLVTNGS